MNAEADHGRFRHLRCYGEVFTSLQVILMTLLGVALLIPFFFGVDLIPSIGLLLDIYCGGIIGALVMIFLSPLIVDRRERKK